MIKQLLRKLNCLTGGHEWTCAAEQGIKATKAQAEGGVHGFNDYAKMYCKHCGKVSELSKRIFE